MNLLWALFNFILSPHFGSARLNEVSCCSKCFLLVINDVLCTVYLDIRLHRAIMPTPKTISTTDWSFYVFCIIIIIISTLYHNILWTNRTDRSFGATVKLFCVVAKLPSSAAASDDSMLRLLYDDPLVGTCVIGLCTINPNKQEAEKITGLKVFAALQNRDAQWPRQTEEEK